MSEEIRFRPIEERLHCDARSLLRANNEQIGPQIRLAYRRRRAIRSRLAAATAVVSAALLGVMFGTNDLAQPHLGKDRDHRAVAIRESERVASRQPSSPVTQAPPDSRFVLDGVPNGPLTVFPFVIEDPTGDGQTISGFYVPEQVEPIDLRELPPAERDAVREVLQLENVAAESGVI